MVTMWKGAIVFALVSVLVRLKAATESGSGSTTHLLCPDHHTRLRSPMQCPVDGRDVPRTQALRGVEVAPDRHVELTEEDLAGLPVPSKQQIAIEAVCSTSEARSHARFARGVYYVEPDPVSSTAYALLRDALAQKDLVAVGRVTLRERERMALLEPLGECLVLSTLAWPDEVRSPRQLDLPARGVARSRETRIAGQLLEAMRGPLDLGVFRDRRTDALNALVEARVAGGEISGPPMTQPAPVLVDLMAALEASVAEARARRADAPSPSARAAGGRSRRRVELGAA